MCTPLGGSGASVHTQVQGLLGLRCVLTADWLQGALWDGGGLLSGPVSVGFEPSIPAFLPFQIGASEHEPAGGRERSRLPAEWGVRCRTRSQEPGIVT